MKATVTILLILCNILVADHTVRLAKISLPDHREVYKLPKFDITVIDAGRDFAKALVNDREIAELRAAGYQIEILIEDYNNYKKEIFERGFYHTYAQVYEVLDSFVADYPGICRLDTIGLSVQGRAIWAMRVTDNPDTEENEPEIRLAGNMHGNEHIGTEITLYFLRHLLTNYATDAQVQALIDNREFWILPTINPDGKVANTRRNANNVDLNRDYGYFWAGWGGSPGPSSQIESKIMMQHLAENNIVLDYNYHSPALYVNYPWAYHYADPADSQHIINLSEIYADSAALTALNGYDWYQITGSLQDYTIGTSGALAWTIETLEPSSSSEIDEFCYNNRDALMDICGRAGWGIEGVVKDSVSGTPLYARIEFVDPDRIDIYTDPNLGDFHKMIEQGTYDLRVSANGYEPKVISDVTVSDTGSTSVGDVLLVPDSSYLYAFRTVLCRYRNHAEQGNATRPRSALGPEDSLFFSLGQAGYVVLDMGPDSPIGNGPGDDMTVYEGDDGTAEGYEVFVSNSWDGSWYSCGSATGTASFDLSVAGLSQARYVRIEDDGSSSSGTHAGFDLDAVEGTLLPIEPHLVVSDYQVLDGNNGSLDPGETADFVITLLNTGILAATNTYGTLRTDDIYVTISDSSGYYGQILPDSEKINTGDPFTIVASDSTPLGHTVSFDLIVQADDYADTLGLDIFISSDTTPPAAPYVTKVEKSYADVGLTWNRVMTDSMGNPEVMGCYVVYRGTAPSFVPGAADSITTVLHPETTYIDSSVLDSAASYYYLVTAVDSEMNRGSKSNMGYVFRKFINENPGATSDRNWVALPYNSEYDSVKDVTDDLSPTGSPISKITRLEPELQDYYSWIYHADLGWYGNDPSYPNYPIVSGQAYEMIGVSDDTIIFVGCNDPAGLIMLNENPGTEGDRNWVSVPYNAIYSTVSAITDELSPGGEPVSKITTLDEEGQVYYSWIYHSVLGWYGNHPTTPNFPIELGDGYEFVATKDTTWNPTEHSNEAISAVCTKHLDRRLDVEFICGTSLEPDRIPVWHVAELDRKVDYRNARAYILATDHFNRQPEYREAGISHLVYVDLELEGYDNLLFTAYRPHRPSDVLTEQSAGCVVARQDDQYRLISFDVGNFRQPWMNGKEMVLIIEATKHGKGYFAVVDFALDQGVDIQRVPGDVVLMPIPDPIATGNTIQWSRIDNDNVVGYSLYRDGNRVNDKVLARNEYRLEGDIVVKPVIKGGYETVYGSRGMQSSPKENIPISYAFNIHPNPFVRQTRIDYALPKQTSVEIVIYDVAGRKIKTLVSEIQKTGYYSMTWDGVDGRSRRISSGIYFIRFVAAEFQTYDKILFVK